MDRIYNRIKQILTKGQNSIFLNKRVLIGDVKKENGEYFIIEKGTNRIIPMSDNEKDYLVCLYN